MKLTLAVTQILAAACLAAPNATTNTLFAELDGNTYDSIDFKEYSSDKTEREVLVRAFVTIDPNDDGTLTVQEISTNQKP